LKQKPSTRRKPAAKKSARPATQKWSQSVTRHSNAMTLEPDVFTLDDPKKIAASLKRSAERSRRRKSEPYRSAMSMLTFYINRAGSKLPAERKRILAEAKDELRKAFDKES
ncbi:DUF3175 domain-containing protein, partial [Microbacteriaceae bacterium K1510]|nr:DUF3175 domain-containing protein [Microbacteriaceae bacterium K1510]